MNVSLRRLLGIFALIAVLALAACNGADDDDINDNDITPGIEDTTPTPEDDDGIVQEVPEATPEDATPEATPEDVAPEATPDDATPEAVAPDAEDEELSLGEAYDNLKGEDSFAMMISIDGVSAAAVLTPGMEDMGAEDSIMMRVEHVNDDRYVVVMDDEQTELVSLWRVNGEYYADMGDGPTEVSEDDPVVGGLIDLVDAPDELIERIDDANGEHSVVRTEQVNGMEAHVAEGSFQVDDLEGTLLFPAGEAHVDSTIWVEVENEHLLRAEMQIQPMNDEDNGAATPDDENDDATPQANGDTIMVQIDVTDIGELEEIEAPVQ